MNVSVTPSIIIIRCLDHSARVETSHYNSGLSSDLDIGSMMRMKKDEQAMEDMNRHMKNLSRTLATAIHSCLVLSVCSLAYLSCVKAFIRERISSSTKLRLSMMCWAILSSVIEILFFIPVLTRPLGVDRRWFDWVGLRLPCLLSIEGLRLLFIMTLVIDVSMCVWGLPLVQELAPYFSDRVVMHSMRASTSNTILFTKVGTFLVPM